MSLFNSLENGFENGFAKYQMKPATGFSITLETSKPEQRTWMCLEEKQKQVFHIVIKKDGETGPLGGNLYYNTSLKWWETCTECSI